MESITITIHAPLYLNYLKKQILWRYLRRKAELLLIWCIFCIKSLTMYILLYILNYMEGDDFMQATIQKWGNSQGIRIPKAFLEALGMMENDLVELNRVDDNIVITKAKKQKELTLEDIFKDFNGEYVAEEFDWGSPVGKEVW